MFESIIGDIMTSVMGVFQGASPMQLGVLGAVALLSGGSMGGLGQLIGRSTLSVFLLGLANMAVGGLMSPDRFTPDLWMDQIQTAWDYMMGVSGGDLLGYFTAFLVANGVIFTGKSMLVPS